ncbi:MAG: DUF2784 family protein [Armatimonadetes bacterium]|nr:DUF2784 family protein [Armatimonadota bacterium]
MFWLAVGNAAFFVFHTALILFNLFGWVSRKTRKWQLVTLGLTACSWLVFGFWRGWGYCLCTDWHLQRPPTRFGLRPHRPLPQGAR